jgi:hypothetical protein
MGEAPPAVGAAGGAELTGRTAALATGAFWVDFATGALAFGAAGFAATSPDLSLGFGSARCGA